MPCRRPSTSASGQTGRDVVLVTPTYAWRASVTARGKPSNTAKEYQYMKKSSEYVMKEGASVTGPSKHLCTIGRQLEGCPQHVGSTAAHQHPLQENFKVFVHAANVGVDLQIQ